MKIYTVIDYDTPFVYLSIGYGVLGITKYTDIQTVGIDYNDWKRKNIASTDEEIIFILEAGNIPHGNWSVSEIKEKFPNSKIITLCSDTIWWMVNGGQQIFDQEKIDLNLELMPQCREWMLQKGWNCDRWMWTCSDKNIEQIQNYTNNNIDKTIDFIGVYGPWTLSEPGYRKDMVDYLRSANCSFTQGGGTGHQDKNLDNIYLNYSKSWFNLGTSSHHNKSFTDMGCIKGWREWISPFFNCLLIHDNHKNIQEIYNINNIVPTYKYGDFQSIIDIANKLKSNNTYYKFLLEQQKNWSKSHTIDKQLTNLLYKHNFI